jgi:hypothetical protein
MGERWPVVMATGHRPQHLSPTQRAWCRDKLRKAAVWLRDECGTTVGISGMALGVDMWFARAVLEAGLDLWAYVPFPEQPEVWPSVGDRREWAGLVARAVRVEYAGELGALGGDVRRRAAVRLLHRRNDMMLADAAAVVAVLDVAKRGGGTRSAVVKALRAGMPGVHLDPCAATVRVGLPDLASSTR